MYYDSLEKKSENENKIIDLHDDITNFENDLIRLYEPFPNLWPYIDENLKPSFFMAKKMKKEEIEDLANPYASYIFGII